MDNPGPSGSRGKNPKKEKVVEPFFVFKPPNEVPYDNGNGEIIAILPYTLGPPKCVKIGTIMESPHQQPLGIEEGGKGPVAAAAAATAGAGAGPSSSGGPSVVTLTGDEIICPNCHHPSMRLLRNLVREPVEPFRPLRCVGIPTCMNIKCMYISPNLRLLPMPRLEPYPVDKEAVLKRLENVDFKCPEKDPIIRELLSFGLALKEKVARSGPRLPVDKTAIDFYKNMSNEEFEAVLKKVFNGRVPDVP